MNGQHTFIWSIHLLQYTFIYLKFICDVWWFHNEFKKGSKYASNFVQTIGKVQLRHWQWLYKCLWKKHPSPIMKAWVTTGVWVACSVQGWLDIIDDFHNAHHICQNQQYWIKFQSWGSWKLVIGIVNGFWPLNLACTVSMSNFCWGSWQLIRSSRIWYL